MPVPEAFNPYTRQLGYPDSERMGELLSLLFDTKKKVSIALALPGTVEEVSAKTEMSL